MIIYSDLVKENKEAFLNKAAQVASMLDIPINWLMGVMYIESKLNHKAINKGSKAVGLIQITPKTAVALGTTTDALLAMSNVEQLDWVYAYLKPHKNKLVEFVDLYFTIFYPAAVGKYFDYVIGKMGGSAEKIAAQNPGLDLDKNNIVTKQEVATKIMSAIHFDYHKFLI